MARPGVQDNEHASKIVNEVWDSCFNDTRPFDEIYRWRGGLCNWDVYVYDMRDVGYVQDVETRCRLCIAMALIYHIELNLNLCSWYVFLTPTSLLQLWIVPAWEILQRAPAAGAFTRVRQADVARDDLSLFGVWETQEISTKQGFRSFCMRQISNISKFRPENAENTYMRNALLLF